jgi:hypothetical protein
VHPCLGGVDLEETRQPLFCGLHETPLTLLIKRPHASDVAAKVSIGDEVGEHGLGQNRRIVSRQETRPGKRLDQAWRHDEIAEAEPGKQYLAQRPEVDYPSVAVQALQGGQGLATIPVLAVIVVFQDPRIGLAGPLEQ